MIIIEIFERGCLAALPSSGSTAVIRIDTS